MESVVASSIQKAGGGFSALHGSLTLVFLCQVLTSHSCSEEGLEDAANVLLQLSRGDSATRDTVLKLLLNGAHQLGYTLCKQIGKERIGVRAVPVGGGWD